MDEESIKKKILIIDDDAVIVQSIQLLFELEGYLVEAMTTGVRTSDVILSTNPDIIILDIMLDGSDGREIVKTLKKNKKTSQIPIILISGVENIQEEAMHCGADDFLPKPFTVDTLLGRVQHHLHLI